MKAFKIGFDGKKFYKVSFDVKHEYDFSNDPDVNLYGEENSHNCTEQSVDYTIVDWNKNLVETITDDSSFEAIMVKKCKDCGKYFIITYDEFMWFKSRNLNTPARCYGCRRKRKCGK